MGRVIDPRHVWAIRPSASHSLRYRILSKEKKFSLDITDKADKYYLDTISSIECYVLTETTLSGIRIALFVALRDSPDPIAPSQIATELDLSKSYCAKITNLLARAGVFRARRGAHGGVELGRSQPDITLLEIVEACQGRILSHYCHEVDNLRHVCAFHRAMVELYDSVTGALSKWTLADLVRKPVPSASIRKGVECEVRLVESALQR